MKLIFLYYQVSRYYSLQVNKSSSIPPLKTKVKIYIIHFNFPQAFQSLQHNFDLSLFIQNAVNNISSMGSLGYLYFASIYILGN